MKNIIRCVLFVGFLASAACGTSMRPDEAITELRNPDPTVRRTAADALRTKDGVPPNAVRFLLEAAASERDAPALGAMLIALGKSGAPEAKPLIEQAVQTANDEDRRRWAGRALRYWMLETKQLPQDHKFPDGWPYGAPGYPPQLPK